MLSNNYFSGVITTTPMDTSGPAANYERPPATFEAAVRPEPTVRTTWMTASTFDPAPVTRSPAPVTTSTAPVTILSRGDVEDTRPQPQRGPPVYRNPDQHRLPDKESTLDLHRHRHDGTQPTREKATPSHRADIEWTIKH